MITNESHVKFILLIILIYFGETMADDSACGDWQPYEEETCVKIFKIGLQSYQEAENICRQQGNETSLITIHSMAEQEFFSSFFKSNHIANDVWIGVKYQNNEYRWNDETELVFSNWAQGSPKNKSDHCVQMNSDESSFGKWSDALCDKGNLVVCHRMQPWSFAQMQKLVLNNIKNPLPIGFIYVQLPNEKSPNEIWPWMIWKDVTSNYAGLFFRAEGGGSKAFGETQEENSPRLTQIQTKKEDGSLGTSVSIVPGNLSGPIFTGSYTNPQTSIRILVSSSEIRPRNVAIRVWKRTG